MNRLGRVPALGVTLVLAVAVLTGCSAGVAGSADSASVASTTSVGSPTSPAQITSPRTSSSRTSSAPSSAAPTSAEPTSTEPTSTEPSSADAEHSGTSSPGSQPESSQPGPAQSGPAPADLSGEVYGFVRSVDVGTSQLTLDKVDWFTGDAAQAACTQDGVQEHDNGWCTGYYYRNVNPALRTVPISSQATITILSGSQDVPGDLTAVSGRIAGSGSTGLYWLVVTDGVVTELHQLYFP